VNVELKVKEVSQVNEDNLDLLAPRDSLVKEDLQDLQDSLVNVVLQVNVVHLGHKVNKESVVNLGQLAQMDYQELLESEDLMVHLDRQVYQVSVEEMVLPVNEVLKDQLAQPD